MKWLLWKDYRVNRVVFIAVAVGLIVPHVLAAILIWRGEGPRNPIDGFGISSFYSLVLLQVAFALLGGNSIAGERYDRSAEFLAYLPVSRGRSLTSKLLVSSAAVPLVWLPNLAILTFVYYTGIRAIMPPDIVRHVMWALATIAITGLTFFCVAWLFSCVLLSPTFSVAAGLLAPLCVFFAIQWFCYLLNINVLTSSVGRNMPATGSGLVAEVTIYYWYWGLCLVLSVASFLTGTLYYLRRLEP